MTRTPPQGLAIVTGATGGLGYEIALGLARAGLHVRLTGRNEARGAQAVATLKATAPDANVRFDMLDVASLASVEAYAATIAEPVAVLVNNAGVMALPQRERTVDGFERQLGTNYLGHFALTARLLPHLRHGRVVNVASLAHRRARIALEDLNSERTYSPWAAYGQSKLAMLMFGLELNARSVVHDWGVQGFAAHPGWSATSIVQNGPGRGAPGLRERIMAAGFNALGQSPAAGALPELHAALDPAARPGTYYGPCCLNETRGRPTQSRIMPQALDQTARDRLWSESETLTKVTFPT